MRLEPAWERPVLARYVDPLEVIWLSTAARLGLTIRRDPAVFSRTDGRGLLALGPRESLDADDTLSQQVLHEICHGVVAGKESFAREDWGYPLDVPLEDPKELATLRLQAWWSGRFDLRRWFGPTGIYRQYWEVLPEDPLCPLDDGPLEREVQGLLRPALTLAQAEPFASVVDAALAATREVGRVIQPFLDDFRSEVAEDPLVNWWAR